MRTNDPRFDPTPEEDLIHEVMEKLAELSHKHKYDRIKLIGDLIIFWKFLDSTEEYNA